MELETKIECPERVTAEYLESVNDDDFHAWADGYMKWASSLPADVDVDTKQQIQEQMDIISAETRRRENANSYFDGGLLQFVGWVLLGVVVTACTLGICFPWALCMVYRWEARHTVISGHRLEFDGTAMQLFGHWIIWLLLTIVTLGIYGLWVGIRLKQWVTLHTHFSIQ